MQAMGRQAGYGSSSRLCVIKQVKGLLADYGSSSRLWVVNLVIGRQAG